MKYYRNNNVLRNLKVRCQNRAFTATFTVKSNVGLTNTEQSIREQGFKTITNYATVLEKIKRKVLF